MEILVTNDPKPNVDRLIALEDLEHDEELRIVIGSSNTR